MVKYFEVKLIDRYGEKSARVVKVVAADHRYSIILNGMTHKNYLQLWMLEGGYSYGDYLVKYTGEGLNLGVWDVYDGNRANEKIINDAIEDYLLDEVINKL